MANFSVWDKCPVKSTVNDENTLIPSQYPVRYTEGSLCTEKPDRSVKRFRPACDGQTPDRSIYCAIHMRRMCVARKKIHR